MLTACAAHADDAQPKLASVFTDHMVLQRDRAVPVWGHAKPGEEVTVEFAGQKKTARADAAGKWSVKLDPLAASAEPRELKVGGAVIRDVLVGEVWLASGQSNMDWPIGWDSKAHEVVPNCQDAGLRLFFTRNGKWVACEPETLAGKYGWGNAGFSAVAYFFGAHLRQKLQCPVGLIQSTVGGTAVEQWSEGGDRFKQLVEPLIPYAMRGVIWYQGESNGNSLQKAKDYANLFPAMIRYWRARWGQEDFPFLYVQLAAFGGHPEWYFPQLRESQHKTLALPNTGMATAIDLGNPRDDIHPACKSEVGKRLALLARRIAYGEQVVATGPVYSSMRIKDGTLRLSFFGIGGNLVTSEPVWTYDGKPIPHSDKVLGLEIAGVDGRYVPAVGVIDGNDVVVSAPEVSKPVAARYNWAMCPSPQGNLYNKEGLPAYPFRTDTAGDMPVAAPSRNAALARPGSSEHTLAGADKSSSDNAKDVVSRHQGLWTAPPRRIPSNRNSDAPMLGNGDIGVLIGGPPEKQQFYISKCDFWRPQPCFPWFTPALVGAIDVEIPAMKGATYRVVQDIAKAEVRHSFTKPEGTVEMRSWTPATGHELLVEISCTGKPVEIMASPWTYFGNGGSVEKGQDGEVSWLTRSFAGTGYDWDSLATLAVSAEGSAAGTEPQMNPITAAVSGKKVPCVIGGRIANDKKPSPPFKGRIHEVRIYDHAVSANDMVQLDKGGGIGLKPVFSSGGAGTEAGSFSSGDPEGISLGEVTVPLKPMTLFLDFTPDSPSGRIFQLGGQLPTGIEVFAEPHTGGYNLKVRAAGRSVFSLDRVTSKKRVVAVITHDGTNLLLRFNGKLSGTSRIDGTPRTLTLQPDKPVRLVASVRTNQEQPDFQATAIKGAKSLDDKVAAKLQKEHCEWWRNFWNESSVELGDSVLESYYYGSFYIMASCSRNKDFAPPIFGAWASWDLPSMGGDYHMNYNHQGPWWGCYAANHISLTDPYDVPVLQYMERGKYMAEKYLGRKGVYYCVGIGPKGSCACWEKTNDGWNNDKPEYHFFAGQKCNALFGGINMSMRWNATLDPDYARKVYPFLRELAAFWESDLVWENAPYEIDRNLLYELNPAPGREGVIHKEGRYSIVHDNIHEGSPIPGGEKNNPMSLGLLRSCLKTTLEMSRELGVDADKREKWQHILDHLSGYTVFERNGKKVFRYSEEGWDFASINGVGLQHVYPADAIGLESSPEMLEITHNTIEQHPQCWKCNNHTMSFYPGIARVGYDPNAILKGLHTLIDECGYPNFVIDRSGGGIETCSTVTATIHEMFLQSHQGVIRIFPNWPKDKDARLDKLRAYGAFLISAEQKGGVVQNVRIVSERGQPCTLRNPWPGKMIELVRNGKSAEMLAGDLVKFTTAIGDIFELKSK